MQLTFYAKSGCHLCEDAWDVMEMVRAQLADTVTLAVETKDITMDASLMARFRYDIPVLEIDGRPAFRHRVDPERLRLRLVEGRPAPLEEEAA